jgi:hypothetical protein
MADSHDIGLVAHLMRRAGFGASREELEQRAAKGYDATVEELLNPEQSTPADEYTLLPTSLQPCCQAASPLWGTSTGCSLWSIRSGLWKRR